MVKKRARTTRAMVTRVVGDKEGDGDGGNMARNNADGLTLSCSSPSCTRSPLALTARMTTSRLDDDCRTGSARMTAATIE